MTDLELLEKVKTEFDKAWYMDWSISREDYGDKKEHIVIKATLREMFGTEIDAYMYLELDEGLDKPEIIQASVDCLHSDFVQRLTDNEVNERALRVALDNLNPIYRRIIHSHNRLTSLIECNAPKMLINNQRRMLNEAVSKLNKTQIIQKSRRKHN